MKKPPLHRTTGGDLVLQEIWRIRVGDIFSLSANWGEGRGEVIPRCADEIRVVRVNRVRHRLPPFSALGRRWSKTG